MNIKLITTNFTFPEVMSKKPMQSICTAGKTAGAWSWPHNCV